MHSTLSSESENWLLPSHETTFESKLPAYEESLPVRVNREGINNYMKSRGSLNLGDWAIEARRKSASGQREDSFVAPPPKVLGDDALRNYTRSRSSTPNLIYGNLDPPNPHHHNRVKREGRENYNRNHNSQMKSLFERYGKLPLPAPPLPHTQGQMATNLFHAHQQGHVGAILNNTGHVPTSGRKVPHIKGVAAEHNLLRSFGHPYLLDNKMDFRPSTAEPHLKGTAAEANFRNAQGHSHLLEHKMDFRPERGDPNVKGAQAQLNYEMGQKDTINKLFSDYLKSSEAAQAAPKVKYGGVENYTKSQGDAMRRVITQCPPSNRHAERPRPAIP